MRIGYIAVLAATAGLVTGCNDDKVPNEAKVNATEGLVFSPMTVIVRNGGVVTWRFFGVGHNVTFDASVSGHPDNITGTNTDTEIDRTFSTVGTFPYMCTIHPNMVGQVIVVEETAITGG